MTTFTDDYTNVYNQAREHIEQVVSRKKEIILLDEELEEKNWDEFHGVLHEIPFVEYVDKHYNYDEYAVMKISLDEENDKVQLHTRNKNSEINDERIFILEELDTRNLCQLADML